MEYKKFQILRLTLQILDSNGSGIGVDESIILQPSMQSLEIIQISAQNLLNPLVARAQKDINPSKHERSSPHGV